MKINVLLIGKSERNINNFKRLIDDADIALIGESKGGSSALDKIENTSPDLIIMSYGEGDTDSLSLAERIILHRPRTFVILIAEFLDVELMQNALKAGCHNIIEMPKTSKDMNDTIKSVYNNESLKLKSLGQKDNLVWTSTVITVFGAKGGLGKSTIAANLAVSLAQKRKKVALIDLDLQFGDLHIFLDIEPKETITELVQDSTEPNVDFVRSYMSIHSSGVHLLAAPRSPEYSELVSAEKVMSLLTLLRNYYDYVIIDTAPTFSEVNVTALECSSLIFFVTGLDISILKNSKLSMSLMESLQLTEKVKIIVNRAMDMSITVNDVQRIIGYPIWSKMPSDYKVAVTALNRGIPFVTGASNSKLAQSISNMAGELISGKINERQKKQKGKLSIFKKK